eukprot:TRINITY_DN10676_c0_g1_i1.p1 TRINITY_DN10676_c0_g1~~TRINITY_DN10676_c0_g1_i1.p1  ORF type:complete len:156 (+),score=65.09 TRINITY_DN10676_c0_g1_i1:82-549(+)
MVFTVDVKFGQRQQGDTKPYAVKIGPYWYELKAGQSKKVDEAEIARVNTDGTYQIIIPQGSTTVRVQSELDARVQEFNTRWLTEHPRLDDSGVANQEYVRDAVRYFLKRELNTQRPPSAWHGDLGTAAAITCAFFGVVVLLVYAFVRLWSSTLSD